MEMWCGHRHAHSRPIATCGRGASAVGAGLPFWVARLVGPARGTGLQGGGNRSENLMCRLEFWKVERTGIEPARCPQDSIPACERKGTASVRAPTEPMRRATGSFARGRGDSRSAHHRNRRQHQRTHTSDPKPARRGVLTVQVLGVAATTAPTAEAAISSGCVGLCSRHTRTESERGQSRIRKLIASRNALLSQRGTVSRVAGSSGCGVKATLKWLLGLAAPWHGRHIALVPAHSRLPIARCLPGK
jgi:hypothetical protein